MRSDACVGPADDGVDTRGAAAGEADGGDGEIGRVAAEAVRPVAAGGACVCAYKPEEQSANAAVAESQAQRVGRFGLNI